MAKESRLAEIYRQELKTKGLLGAYLSAANERRKERYDIRNILPQSGLTGAAFQKVFGRPYRYGSSSAGQRMGSGAAGSMDTKPMVEKLTRIGIDSRMTAKNTIVLPAMARDFNLVRQNMAKLVKAQGMTPAMKADMFFKRIGERESAYESKFGKESGGLSPTSVNAGTEGTGKKSWLQSILGGIASLFTSKAGLIAGLLGLIGGYFLSDDFKKMVDGLLESIFGPDFKEKLAGIALGITAAYLAFKGAISLLESALGQLSKYILEKITGTPNTPGQTTTPDIPVPDRTGGKPAPKPNTPGGILGGRLGLGLRFLGLAGVIATVGIALNDLYDALVKASEDGRAGPPPTAAEDAAASTPANLTPLIAQRNRRIEEEKLRKDQEAITRLTNSNAELEAMIKAESPNAKAARANIESNNKTIQQIKNRNPRLNENAPSRSSAADTTDDPRKNRSYSPEKVTPMDRKALLDLIASGEAINGSYDSVNTGKIGKILTGLSNMTVAEVMKRQADGEFRAAGRYQIIPSTLNGLVRQGIVKPTDKFDSATQDKLANALIDARLRAAGDDPIKQQLELSKEWAAIANPLTGNSYYAGNGIDKASITSAQVQGVLSGATLVASNNNTGSNVNRASLDNQFASAAYEQMNPIVNVNMPQQTAQVDRGRQEVSAMNPEALLLFLVNAVTDPS